MKTAAWKELRLPCVKTKDEDVEFLFNSLEKTLEHTINWYFE